MVSSCLTSFPPTAAFANKDVIIWALVKFAGQTFGRWLQESKTICFGIDQQKQISRELWSPSPSQVSLLIMIFRYCSRLFNILRWRYLNGTNSIKTYMEVRFVDIRMIMAAAEIRDIIWSLTIHRQESFGYIGEVARVPVFIREPEIVDGQLACFSIQPSTVF